MVSVIIAFLLFDGFCINFLVFVVYSFSNYDLCLRNVEIYESSVRATVNMHKKISEVWLWDFVKYVSKQTEIWQPYQCRYIN